MLGLFLLSILLLGVPKEEGRERASNWSICFFITDCYLFPARYLFFFCIIRSCRTSFSVTSSTNRWMDAWIHTQDINKAKKFRLAWWTIQKSYTSDMMWWYSFMGRHYKQPKQGIARANQGNLSPRNFNYIRTTQLPDSINKQLAGYIMLHYTRSTSPGKVWIR